MGPFREGPEDSRGHPGSAPNKVSDGWLVLVPKRVQNRAQIHSKSLKIAIKRGLKSRSSSEGLRVAFRPDFRAIETSKIVLSPRRRADFRIFTPVLSNPLTPQKVQKNIPKSSQNEYQQLEKAGIDFGHDF